MNQKREVLIMGTKACMFVSMFFWLLSSHHAYCQDRPRVGTYTEHYLEACRLLDDDFDRDKAVIAITRLATEARRQLGAARDIDMIPRLVNVVLEELKSSVHEIGSGAASFSVTHAATDKTMGVPQLALITLLLAQELELPVHVAYSGRGEVYLIERHPQARVGFFIVASERGPLYLRFVLKNAVDDKRWDLDTLADDEWLALVLALTIDPGNEKETQRRLALARRLAPTSPRAPAAAAALVHWSGKRPEQARTLYLEALEKGTREPVVYTNLGSLELQMGDAPKVAITHLKQGRALGDSSDLNAELLARALVQSGEVTEAVTILEDGLKEHPHSPELLRMLAQHCLDTGKYKRAWQMTIEALRRNPLDEEVYQLAAAVLLKDRSVDPNEVVRLTQWIKDAIVARPRSVALWRALAVSLAYRGDYDSACSALQNAVSVHGPPKPDWYERDLSVIQAAARNADSGK